MPLPLTNMLGMLYSDEGRSRRLVTSELERRWKPCAKAEQLRKGAWLQRSFTLSTINFLQRLRRGHLSENQHPQTKVRRRLTRVCWDTVK